MKYLSSLVRLSAAGFVSLIVGCGGDDTTSVPTPVADAGTATDTGAATVDAGTVLQTVVITETEYMLAPNAVTFNTGAGMYVFMAQNKGTIVHSLAIRDGVTAALMPNLNPNQDGNLMVNLQVGKYTMFCPIPGHEQLGMVGTVVVTAPTE